MIFDPLYIAFMLPGLLIGLWAQAKLSSSYGRYRRVRLASGLSGAEAARVILDRAGLVDVPVQEVPGHLTDHYDPSKRLLCLSSENFRDRSVAAVGVAAHEAGHALQHQASYAPLNLRMALVPVTQFASYAWVGILMLGFVLGAAAFAKLIWVAIAVFMVTMVFQLITLPVEFDASKRAKEQLLRLGIVHLEESRGVNQVLSAAALTYVAALVGSIMQLLYFLTLARNRS
jgi:Zn-dependent membrane protease YugP